MRWQFRLNLNGRTESKSRDQTLIAEKSNSERTEMFSQKIYRFKLTFQDKCQILRGIRPNLVWVMVVSSGPGKQMCFFATNQAFLSNIGYMNETLSNSLFYLISQEHPNTQIKNTKYYNRASSAIFSGLRIIR